MNLWNFIFKRTPAEKEVNRVNQEGNEAVTEENEESNDNTKDQKMEVGAQIKKYRSDLKLSQEELAEQIYVTRQTISNWENAKSYPDIHSLLLLSALFQVSLDHLIKGDIEIMKEEIKTSESKKFNRYGLIYTILLAATVISAIPLFVWMDWYAFIPWAVLFGITMYFAVIIEQMKKENDIHTYKEIVAFTKGKRLDEMTKQQELGKRPYQKIFMCVLSGAIGFFVARLMGYFFFG